MEVEGHPGLQALSAGRLLVKILYPCLALAVLLVVARIIHAVYLSPLRQIPGPLICRLTDLCLTYHDSRLSRNQKIFEWHEKYGDVVLIAPGQVSFASAAAARELYSAAVRHPKSSYFDNLSAYGFRSIFMIRDHTEHQQMKKRTFRCYQPASIYRPSILGDVRDLAKRSRDRMRADLKQNGATINIFARCNSYSFDNITRFALGPFLSTNAISEAPEERAMFIGWEECEVWGPFGSNFPTTQKLIKTMVRRAANDAFLTGDDRLGDWTNAQVATAMEEPRKSGEDSLLHQLLQVKTENGDKLPAGAITEEIFDNFLAAQSVVTNALVFLLWDLATHPDWQSQIRKEIQALPTDGDGLPIFIEINSAPILDACLRESSRVHPLSSGRAERVIHETKAYEGIVLPAGASVSHSTLPCTCFPF